MIVPISECRQYLNQEVTIQGWLVHKRSSGQVRFLVIRDGSGILQAILLKNQVPAEVFQSFDQLTQESSLVLTGILRDDSRAPGGVELELRRLVVLQLTQLSRGAPQLFRRAPSAGWPWAPGRVEPALRPVVPPWLPEPSRNLVSPTVLRHANRGNRG